MNTAQSSPYYQVKKHLKISYLRPNKENKPTKGIKFD